jgi:hypothetical protein
MDEQYQLAWADIEGSVVLLKRLQHSKRLKWQ